MLCRSPGKIHSEEANLILNLLISKSFITFQKTKERKKGKNNTRLRLTLKMKDTQMIKIRLHDS